MDRLRAGESYGTYNDMKRWPYLVLDDIGAERDPSGFSAEKLTTLLGYDALAITDTDGMYGMVRAWLEAKQVGLRLIVGCELTVEDGSIGGLGAHVLTMASDEGLIDSGLKLRTMRLPDRFQDQDSPAKQYDEAGLNAPQIVDTILKALRMNSVGVVEEARA